MLNTFKKLTISLPLLTFLVAAHGELAYKTSDESYGENLKNLIVMVLVGVLVDWVRIKLKIPMLSTEKLVYADKKNISVEEKKETEGFEPSKQSPVKETPKLEDQKTEIEIPEKPIEAKEDSKLVEEQTAAVVPTETEKVEAEKIILSASMCLSTHNLEPTIAHETIEDKKETQPVSWDFEEFIANLNKPSENTFTRPRFNSDPTGQVERWGIPLETDEESKLLIGERTPETTPEIPSVETLSQDIPNLQEPGSGTQTISEDWLLPEDKVNERKPMVFIGGVSASTTPMEVVYELKKQGFNVTVVPRIRYGVSFGFCPDLVLSSEEEVETLLAMKKIWIKDRWIDVRPYVPKDEESTKSSSSSASTPAVATEPEKSVSTTTETPRSPASVVQNVQEVSANVFTDTCGVAISSPTSEAMSTPNQMPVPEYETPIFIQGSPQMPLYNGYDCTAFIDPNHLNMSPPGSLCSTPTFIPSHAIPAPMMFPMPMYTPHFPAEFVYPEMAHQPFQHVPYEQQPLEQY